MESDEERVISELDRTVVGDPCAAEIELHELIAADQASPHDCVSHLSAG